MLNEGKPDRLKERVNKRRISRSPMNIRGKIKELEEQLDKKEKMKTMNKMVGNLKQPEHAYKVKHDAFRNSKQQFNNQKATIGAIPDTQKYISPSKGIKLSKQSNHKAIHRFQDNMQPQIRKRLSLSPRKQILRIRSEGTGTVNRQRIHNLERSEYDIDVLREQNMQFRNIYHQSLEKIEYLEQKLEQLKERQAYEQNHLQRRYKQLQQRVQQQPKVTLGHIYTFEDKNNEPLDEPNIIAQTDNEMSSCHVSLALKKKITSYSALSIVSK